MSVPGSRPNGEELQPLCWCTYVTMAPMLVHHPSHCDQPLLPVGLDNEPARLGSVRLATVDSSLVIHGVWWTGGAYGGAVGCA